MRVLATRPEHDVTTHYISRWGESALAFARERGADVVDLRREKANRREFEGRMRKLDPELVFLNGHGSESSVCGHDDEPLVLAGDNHGLLHGRVTYALSCQAARNLGPSCAEAAGTAFIGYKDDFLFTASAGSAARPLDDGRSAPFFEASNLVVTSLLKGHAAGEASRRSKDAFRAHTRRLLSSSTDPDALLDAQCLWWDMTHQVCLGDEGATVG